jgi:hypothetical protein
MGLSGKLQRNASNRYFTPKNTKITEAERINLKSFFLRFVVETASLRLSDG